MLARPDITDVYAARQETYASVAALAIDTGGRSPEDITSDILSCLAGD
jgi:shikimate kinase